MAYAMEIELAIIIKSKRAAYHFHAASLHDRRQQRAITINATPHYIAAFLITRARGKESKAVKNMLCWPVR